MNTKNRKAFLDMIAWSEGTSTIPESDNGYNVLVGGKLFFTYNDHPRQLVVINSKLKSTAAGRYQLLSRYYDYYKKLLKLDDFSAPSQDAIAIQQIKECRALDDVDAGNFERAVKKCSNIWASFPGNNYGQHQQKISALLAVYTEAGGEVV
ncbi:MAG: glycoside hydrolase family 104 protein [Deltaproteobacteria bacterium]|nr:glycoside hydrolase family 104 protein [Deltaproteobacteria bacterium]